MASTASYQQLRSTTEDFIQALRSKTPGTNEINSEAVLSLCAPSFRLNFGHDFFVGTNPMVQGEKDAQGFVDHMSRMVPKLRIFTISISNVCVDVEQRSVVVRAEFEMTPKNGESVINDIVLWMTMDESGKKLTGCTEFVDAAATMELGKRMKASTEP